jgi:hypothetical protein
VVSAPDVRDTHTNLRLAVDRLRIEGEEYSVGGVILVRAPRYPVYTYGDELEVEGRLEAPPVLEGCSYRDYRERITLGTRSRGKQAPKVR